MSKQIVSKQGTLQGRDFLKGLLIAVLTAVFALIQVSLDSGTLTFDWKAIGIAALSAAAAYLFKNLVEPTKVVDVVDGEEAKKIIEENKENDTLGV